MNKKLNKITLLFALFFCLGTATGFAQYDEGGGDDDWDNDYDPNSEDPGDLDPVIIVGTGGGSDDDGGWGEEPDDDPWDNDNDDDDDDDEGGGGGSDGGSGGSNNIPADFNRSVSIPIPAINTNLRLRVKLEPLKITIAPLVLHMPLIPTANIMHLLTNYNNINNTTINFNTVKSQVNANNQNQTQMSPEVIAFMNYIQNVIIQGYIDDVDDSNVIIEFDDCDGSSYCTSDSDCRNNFDCRPGEILDENCECQINLLDPCANKDLRNYVVSPPVLSLMNSRTQPNTMVQSNQQVSSFNLETIDDGWGDINQDRFAINITRLPNGYTPFQLFNEIRMNFTNLVSGGNIPYITDVNLEPYSSQDGVTWNSNNPVGAAMDFDTMIDTSTVYCVEYNAEEMYWIFATVTSYDHQGHFVAGLRQFGLEPNGSGGHSFYVRAADRLGGILDSTFNGVAQIFEKDALFTHAGAATWNNLMENTVSFIQNTGGDADEFNSDRIYGARHPYNEGDCPD